MAERRFWHRVGLTVTKAQAIEWVDKVSAGPPAGEYLVDDVDEFAQVTAPTSSTLREEIEDLFNNPAEDVVVELDPINKAIVEALAMEQNKLNRLRSLIAEGYTKAEAKEIYEKEMGLFIADALNIDLEEFKEKQEKMIADTVQFDPADLTVPELKERLKDLGLPVSGKKAELVERLKSQA